MHTQRRLTGYLPIAHHVVAGRDDVCFGEDYYCLGPGMGRGLGVGVILGVGVGVGDGAPHGVASITSSTYIPVRPPAPF